MDILILLKANLKERHLFVLKKLLKRSQNGFVSFVFLQSSNIHFG